MLIIQDFPRPPSTNTHLLPVMSKVKWRQGKPTAVGRLVKSGAHRDYEAQCYLWSLKYKTGLENIRAEINKERIQTESKGDIFALKIEAFICLSREYIITADNKPAQVDTSNFLKSLEDNLFKHLGIDDKYVYPVSIEKVYIDDDSAECAVVKITKATARSKSQIMTQILG